MASLLALPLFVLLAPLRCDAWGMTGHLATSKAAESALSPQAAAGVARDLAMYASTFPHNSGFVSSAVWMDTIKSSEHFFNHLHFVDYAVVQPGYNETPAVPDLVGDATYHVQWALQQAAYTLHRGSKADDWSRSLAARWATHLIGEERTFFGGEAWLHTCTR